MSARSNCATARREGRSPCCNSISPHWRCSPRRATRLQRTRVRISEEWVMALAILMIDDEADIRDLVSGILEHEGFGTRTAADSDSALAALSDRRPSLVILDIWLDRKSTRLNSSHVKISYAVFCLKKKKSSS